VNLLTSASAISCVERLGSEMSQMGHYTLLIYLLACMGAVKRITCSVVTDSETNPGTVFFYPSPSVTET